VRHPYVILLHFYKMRPLKGLPNQVVANREPLDARERLKNRYRDPSIRIHLKISGKSQIQS
jgi:hypothetical protein